MVVVDNNKDTLVFSVTKVREKKTRFISKGRPLYPMTNAGEQTVKSYPVKEG